MTNIKEIQVVWRGFVHDAQGYARAAREYILALDRQGVDVKIEPLNLGTPSVELNSAQANKLRELVAKPLAQGKKKILVYHSQPFGLNPDTVDRSVYDYVIFNTVWETDRIPQDWFPNINKADAVFVPCKHNSEALLNSGVTIPIYIAPHGADIENFNPENTPLPLVDVKDAFSFLSVFQWQHRKAPDVLLKAYWKAFTQDDKVALILKTYWSNSPSKSDQREVLDTIHRFKLHNGYNDENTAPIYATFSVLSDHHLKGLYALADAFVLPSRGEGVGLPYIEALSSGIPVIATRWGGQADFLTDDNSFNVQYRLEPTTLRLKEALAPNYAQLFTDEMNWAEPSVDDLARQMRFVYDNQTSAAEKGKQGRKDMEGMTWDKIALAMITYFDEIA